MATVIPASPSPWDTASQAFQRAFELSAQLAQQRAELDVQRRRVASQENVDRAQVSQIEQQVTDLNNKIQGNRVATAHIGQSDEEFVQTLARLGLDESIVGYAQQFRTDFKEKQATAALRVQQVEETRAQAALHAQQAADLQQASIRAAAVQDVLSRFPNDALLRDPDAQQQAIIKVAALDLGQAQQLAQAFAMTNGRYAAIFGPSGDLFVVNTRSGDVRPSRYSVGQRTAAGGTAAQNRANIIQLASAQAIRALEESQALVRLDKDSDAMPVVASGLAGMGNAPLIGGLVRGFTAPAGQSARSPHQQQFEMTALRFSEHYFKMLPAVGPRGERAMRQLIDSYYAPSGSAPESRRNAYAKRQELIEELRELANAYRDGRTPDFTRLPGFNTAANEAVREIMNPEAPTGQQPLSPLDFHPGDEP